MLNIKTIVTGILNENCYIVYKDKKALIIDPGYDSNKIIKFIESNDLDVKGVLITHHHFDHVGALKDIQSEYKNAKYIDYKDNGNKHISCFEFEIINTPGHTLDSVTYYFKKDNIMFTGDFVFKETIGNYEYDNESIMIDSLKNFIKYPNNTTIYPGHGESSTIEYEKKNNPFLRGL